MMLSKNNRASSYIAVRSAGGGWWCYDVRTDPFERVLPRVVSILEEPVASSSIVPMYFVSERARQDVKGVFVGQGPDELFGG